MIRWADHAPERPGGPATVWIVVAGSVPRPGPPNPTDQADALRHPASARAAFLLRRRLLRQLVARHLGTGVDNVVVESDAAGAPRLRAPACGLSVSSASRDGWLALAVAPSPVGVDIERLGAAAEPAWNVLAPTERPALEATPEPSRWAGFLHLWTAKEAYLKAIGTGLGREPADVAVRLEPENHFTVRDRGRLVRLIAAEHRRVTSGDIQLIAACVILPG